MICYVSVSDSCAVVILLVILVVRRKRRKAMSSGYRTYDRVSTVAAGTLTLRVTDAVCCVCLSICCE